MDFDWLALYAMVAADTGWSWEVVGRLTFKRYRALYARFRLQPPTHWLVAAFMGWKPPAESDPNSDIDVRDLFDAIPGGNGKALTTAMLPMLGLM